MDHIEDVLLKEIGNELICQHHNTWEMGMFHYILVSQFRIRHNKLIQNWTCGKDSTNQIGTDIKIICSSFFEKPISFKAESQILRNSFFSIIFTSTLMT